MQLDGFPDPEKLAGAYGFKGRTVERPRELRNALEAAVREPGPYLLNVRVTPFENVYPMVPAGGAINEMVLGRQPVRRLRRSRRTCEGLAEELGVMLQLISLLMENKPGALMRVTGLLTARGYNIESLTVARTLDPELSRMSIVVDIEPAPARSQFIKQMNKLINVLQASDLTEVAGGPPRAGAGAGARRPCRIARRSSRKPRSSAPARWIPRSKASRSKPPAIRKSWTSLSM